MWPANGRRVCGGQYMKRHHARGAMNYGRGTCSPPLRVMRARWDPSSDGNLRRVPSAIRTRIRRVNDKPRMPVDRGRYGGWTGLSKSNSTSFGFVQGTGADAM